MRKVDIVLWGYFSYFSEIPPRASWEIVVFKMVAKVQVWNVPPSNIIVGFLSLDELVVLSNDVNGGRMRSNRAGSRDECEEKSISAPIVVDEIVGDDDEDVVDDLVESDGRVLHEDGSESVEDFND